MSIAAFEPALQAYFKEPRTEAEIADYRAKRGFCKKLQDEVMPALRHLRFVGATGEIRFELNSNVPDCWLRDGVASASQRLEVTLAQSREQHLVGIELNKNGIGRGFLGLPDYAPAEAFSQVIALALAMYSTEGARRLPLEAASSVVLTALPITIAITIAPRSKALETRPLMVRLNPLLRRRRILLPISDADASVPPKSVRNSSSHLSDNFARSHITGALEEHRDRSVLGGQDLFHLWSQLPELSRRHGCEHRYRTGKDFCRHRRGPPAGAQWWGHLAFGDLPHSTGGNDSVDFALGAPRAKLPKVE
ncbi:MULTISPECIES: hypothetical protein [Bradyrhizobium]|uniref:hypothetical protein n=1 Tax=Bradyrhizobium TaxID=374 RepID=UPI0035DC3CE4